MLDTGDAVTIPALMNKIQNYMVPKLLFQISGMIASQH
jgi:hypothetical protein